MKTIKYLLLGCFALAGTFTLTAQSDEYLDDTYLSRKDIEARQAKARERAEAERKQRLAAERLWQEQVMKERQELLKAQRSREIDAYNGVLSAEDSLRIAAEAQLYARERFAERGREAEGYTGEYARRLRRFYGNGASVVINNYYGDDFYPDWHSHYNWQWGSRASFWGYYPWSYGHYAHCGSWHNPWYDDYYYYSPYRWGVYGGFYAGYRPYWGGYYSYYPSYYYDYPYWGGFTVYRGNTYRNASRSAYNVTQGGYGAYEQSRRQYQTDGYYSTYNRGYSRSGSNYEGRGRSIHDNERSYRQSTDTYRSSSSSYSQPERSYSEPVRSNYGGGGSRSRR